MSDMLDVFKTNEHFATTDGIASWDGPPRIRLWQVGANGEPIEITTKEDK